MASCLIAALPAHAQNIPRTLSPQDAVGLWDGEEGVRGQMSLVFQTLHTDGLILGNGVNNNGAITDTHSLTMALDYRVSDRWEVHASLPYVRKRSLRDPGSHDPSRLKQPHPDSRFLDDGNYHGSWQDWALGVSWAGQWRAFDIEPSATLVLPSHDYTFFANAAPGQRLYRLRLGVDATHRLPASNLYYSVGYSYELVEKVMGIHLDKQHARATVGYYFNPYLSGRAFAQGRWGQGRDSQFFSPARADEYWYYHDQLSRHDYAIAGLGATWRFNDRWALSLTGATMVWGRTVHELEYAYDVQIARAL